MVETFVSSLLHRDMHTHHWRRLVKRCLFIGKMNQDPPGFELLMKLDYLQFSGAL